MLFQTRFNSLATMAVFAFALATSVSATTVYTATLSGANEVPANPSTATGTAILTLSGNLLTVSETFSGMSAAVSGSHIHCCGAIGTNDPVAVPFTGYPALTSGSYTNTFDLSLTTTYTSAFLTTGGGTAAGAEAALIAGLNSGQAYVNIHDATYPGGEIRGFLAATPEPATAALLLLPIAGLVFWKRRTA